MADAESSGAPTPATAVPPVGSRRRVRCAIVGSGNIGTDLMEKVLRSGRLELAAFVGIDPASEGLDRARAHGIPASHGGIDWLLEQSDRPAIVFEATSAAVHAAAAPRLRGAGIRRDRPHSGCRRARRGPVREPRRAPRRRQREHDHLRRPGHDPGRRGDRGRRGRSLREIVATISSRSAGPGTRANIDEFTETTAHALVGVGRAATGKAIIILNPAEPPILMRDTIYAALVADADRGGGPRRDRERVSEVAEYVPGYRLKQDVLFDTANR